MTGRAVIRTACPLDCWDTCALLVEVEGGEVRGLRPDPDHPVTRGRVCPKARFQLDRHRSAGRLLGPLVRSGGTLKASSWDAALDAVAGRLVDARRRHGSLAVLHYWDAGSMGLLKGLWHRLFNLFGGVTEPHGSLCWAAGIAAQEADFGAVLSHSPDDLEGAGAVVIWGRNPADTNAHFMPDLEAAAGRGAPIVVVDPVRTATVKELGARHVAIRPGTDAVLALALAGELIRRGAEDREFCEGRAAGFGAFAAAATAVSATDAAAQCGIDPGDFGLLADLLTDRARRPAAFLIGYGLQRHARGGEAVRGIDALAAVAGSIGRPGGGANYANRHALGLLADLTAPGGARARRYFDRAAFGRQVAEMLGRDGAPIEVLVCERANPLAQLPNVGLAHDTFRRIPFKVVAEIRPTDTTALADVVLPVADFLEDEDLYFSSSWHTHFTWGVPAVSPAAEARREIDVIDGLASRLGLGGEFGAKPADWIARALEPLVARFPDLAPGGDVKALRGRSFANPAAVAVPWVQGPFATPSGRFEFGQKWECLRAPGSRTGGGSPGGGPSETGPSSGRRRFHLITPQHRFSLHSMFYEETLKRTSRGTGLPAVFVNPRAAAALGLDDGRKVRVTTGQGEIIAHLVHDPGQREDTVLIYSGGPAGLAPGGAPASANLLTPDRLTDIGGQAAYYDCLCTLSPA